MSMKPTYNDSKHIYNREWMRKWYANLTPEEREKHLAKNRLWCEKNIEKVRANKRAYRLANRDILIKKQRAYWKTNLEYLHKYQHKQYLKYRKERLAKQKTYSKQKSIKRKQDILRELGQDKCQNCGFNKWLCSLDIHHINGRNDLKKQGLKFSRLSQKQIIEYIRGNPTNKNNLMVLCKNCHQAYHSGFFKLPVKAESI